MIYLLLFYKPIRGSSEALHSCMCLSQVDASLGRSAIFILALTREALLGVGRRGCFSSHMFPDVYHCWISAHWVFSFNMVYSNTLDICLRWILSRDRSGNSLEGSAPFLRVLLIFSVQRFPEEAQKLSANFLIVLLTFSERRLRKRRRTF